MILSKSPWLASRLAVRRTSTRSTQLPQTLMRSCFRAYSTPGSVERPVVTSLTKTCPSCGATLPTALPVCQNCNYIARLHESIPYHDVLGLPYAPNPFVVDSALLKRRFVDAQRICHPDAWATKSEDQKDAALAVSNTVNAAYNTLASPLRRVEYILRRNGIELAEADQLDDLDLINEVMDVREEIDSVRPGGRSRLEELRDENDVKIREVREAIEILVATEDWTAASAAAVRLKYLQGIEDAIKQELDYL
ncbi:hypothetical protein F5I97DRAFT_1894072 [Phlebopus sp. FC_14]|nr:hypothetical protein F5I97DRAFT_1894072 [Phlebopus sp. FC_14]